MHSRSTSRFVLTLLLAGTAPAAAHAEEPAAAAAARVELARECRAFAKDYEMSRSPKLLANLGLCAVRLERDGEAIDTYEEYLDDDRDLTSQEHDRIAHYVQDLQMNVAYLTLTADQAGVMVSDARVPAEGERVTNEYGPVDGQLYLRVRPGHHIVTATLAGYEDATWELDTTAASHDSYAFGMVRLDRPVPPPIRVNRGVLYGPWLVAGVGGAMLIAGTVTGIAALNKHAAIDDHCPNGLCPSSFDLASERSSGKTFAAVTDVLLIGGALAVAGGVTWFLLGPGGLRHER